jgi:peptide/nickel transport system permease protein
MRLGSPLFGRNRSRALLGALMPLVTLLLTLTGLLFVTFTLSRLSPLDPALQLLGDHASSASYAAMRSTLGLDAPWPTQFQRYVGRLMQGDLGLSLSTGDPVTDDLRRVFPATVELAVLAMVLSAGVGVPLAVLGASRPGSIMDGAVRVVSLLGNSVPIFWLGLLALYGFYAHWRLVGGPGRLDDAFEYTIDMRTGFVLLDSWRSHVPGAFASAVSHMVLPVVLLGAYAAGGITRLTRAGVLAEVDQEYVTLARAKGASETRIVLCHILPNTSSLLVTVLALAFAGLLEGAVLVETVFARPGLGRYVTTALFAADTPAILGGTLLIGVCFVLINGVADLGVKLLDPRTR